LTKLANIFLKILIVICSVDLDDTPLGVKKI